MALNTNSYSQSTLSSQLPLVIRELAPYYLASLLVICFWAVACKLAAKKLEVKEKYLALLVALYFLIFSVCWYPQSYDELSWLSRGLRWLLPEATLPLWFLTGVAPVGYILLRSFKSLRIKILFSSMWLFFVFVLNNPLIWSELMIKSVHLKKISNFDKHKKPIILIGLDGIRPGTLEKEAKNFFYLNKFLSESQSPEMTISPIARTYPALSSVLTGLTPTESGVRSNLQASMAAPDQYLNRGAILDLKEQGYQFSIGISDAKFAIFPTGKLVENTFSPTPGIKNFLLPAIFREKLIWASLNNPIGLYLFPDLFDRGITPFEHPSFFLKRVVKNLNNQIQSGKPFISLAHNSFVHYPGAFAFPVYDSYRGEDTNSAYFAYTLNSSISSKNETTFSDRPIFNYHLYEKAAHHLIEYYLEPLLKEFYLSENINQSNIVLYSDHGESFNNRYIFPVEKAPNHGASLILGADDENSVLYVRAVNSDKIALPKKFSLSDILNIFTTQKYHTELTSESDYWIRMSIPDAIIFKMWKRIWTNSDLTQKIITVNPNFFEPILFSKHRAVYDTGKRFTLAPSIYGFISDPPQIETPAVYEKFKQQFESDIQKGYLTDLQYKDNKIIPKWPLGLNEKIQKDPTHYQWMSLHKALYDWHALRDSASAVELFELIIKFGTNELLKALATESVLEICRLPTQTSDIKKIKSFPFSLSKEMETLLSIDYVENLHQRIILCQDEAPLEAAPYEVRSSWTILKNFKADMGDSNLFSILKTIEASKNLSESDAKTAIILAKKDLQSLASNLTPGENDFFWNAIFLTPNFRKSFSFRSFIYNLLLEEKTISSYVREMVLQQLVKENSQQLSSLDGLDNLFTKSRLQCSSVLPAIRLLIKNMAQNESVALYRALREPLHCL